MVQLLRLPRVRGRRFAFAATNPVQYASRATLKIFRVKYASRADFNVFFVDYASRANCHL